MFNQGDSSSAPHAPEAFRNFVSEMESLQGGKFVVESAMVL